MAATETPAAGRQQELTERLQALVTQASRARGLRALSDEELLEFGRLYRRASAELSHARSHGFSAAEAERLNALVGRAYGLLYVAPRAGLRSVPRFFSLELPRALRHNGPFIALSSGLLLLGALAGVVLSILHPALLEIVSPDIAEAVREVSARHEGGRDWLARDLRPIASSLIMVNNIQVSFLAFSTGVLLGLGTGFVLIFNGFMLGAIAAGVTPTPAGVHFWAFVAPHGVIELPAIVVSGAAGLRLGFSLIDPGERSRLDALRLAGRQAAVLMLGVVAFLAAAGVIEGLFSPALAPPALKFAAAALLAAALALYVALPGRAVPDQP